MRGRRQKNTLFFYIILKQINYFQILRHRKIICKLCPAFCLTSYYSVLDIFPLNCSVISIIIKDAHRALSNHCSISFNVCSHTGIAYSVRANTVIKFIKIKLQSISIGLWIILSVQHPYYLRIQLLQFGYRFITHIIKLRMVTEQKDTHSTIYQLFGNGVNS